MSRAAYIALTIALAAAVALAALAYGQMPKMPYYNATYNVTGYKEDVYKQIEAVKVNCTRCIYNVRDSVIKTVEQIINRSRVRIERSHVKWHNCTISRSTIEIVKSIVETINTTIRNSMCKCVECTMMGNVTVGRNSTLILENANLIKCKIKCVGCKAIISRLNSSYVNATLNHTKAWIKMSSINPHAHNVTICVEVETPGVTLTLNITTRYCKDNMTVVKVGNAYMNVRSCRPVMTLTVTTKSLNLTVYHGIYDRVHSVLVHTDAERLVSYVPRPRPDVIANVTVDAPRGVCSTTIIENVTRPSMVLANNTGVPYSSTEYCPCPCWTYTSNSVLVKVMHSSPVTISLLQVTPTPTPTPTPAPAGPSPLIWLLYLALIAFAILAIVLIVKKVRARRGEVIVIYPKE